MKKKLVKRPLLAYASGKKGDVYGYDWGFWDCLAGATGTVALAAGTSGAAATGQVWGIWAGAIATSALGAATWNNCF